MMEQGELDSSPDFRHSPPVIELLADDEDDMSDSPIIVEQVKSPGDRDDNEDALDIKPPPITSKKDKHKHKHKEDKRRDRDRDRTRDHRTDRDKGKHREGRRDKERAQTSKEYDDKYSSTREREKERDRERDKERERERERDRERDRERRRKEQEELEIVEMKRREKSQRERERLERLERERRKIEREREVREREHRDKLRQEQDRLAKAEREKERLIRAERERSEKSRRRKEDSEERRSHSTRQEVEKRRDKTRHRDPKELLKKEEKSRSRSPRKKDKYYDDKYYERPTEDKYQRSVVYTDSKDYRHEEPEREETHYEESHEESYEEPYEEPQEEVLKIDSDREEPAAHSEPESSSDSSSDSESDDSESNSESESEESIKSPASQRHSEAEQPNTSTEDHPLQASHKYSKSKFDDPDEEEDYASPVSPVRAHSDTDDSQEYIEDTPPQSPVELAPKLPPYLPAIQGCRNVEEFHCLNRIEEGTYGVVYRARDKKTNEIVALKRLKMEKEKEGFPITSLREINTLLKAQHVNIVTVREIVVGSNMDKIYIVMDYVEHDLKSLMETMKEPFIIGEVKCLMQQLLRGVAHLHDNWIIHRDLKTSNLLLSHNGILKIGDFGLAREYGSPLKQYTSIVVTLWYRAPELLLGIKEYSTHIDMWSVGCIFAELINKKPLFPGKSELDELTRIFKDLGTPNEKIWKGVSELPGMKKCTFADYPYNQLRNRFNSLLTEKGFDLMNRFLCYDPSKRITSEEGLRHNYFQETPLPIDTSMFPTWPAKSEQARRTHGNTPKPPSGGKAYAKLLGDDDDEAIKGFHLTHTNKGAAAGGLGFALKF